MSVGLSSWNILILLMAGLISVLLILIMNILKKIHESINNLEESNRKNVQNLSTEIQEALASVEDINPKKLK